MKIVTATLLLTWAATSVYGQSHEYNGEPGRSLPAQSTDQIIVKWRAKHADPTRVPATSRVRKLASSSGLSLQRKQRITDDTEVLQLERRLGGAELNSVLARLALEPEVEYAVADQRRFAHALPTDPLIAEQWYFLGAQPSATRAEQAWDLTTGSNTTVVAILDTGIRYEHPDLGRAEEGGKLLPGFDFVTQLIPANDSDGRDADASDPGDWVTDSDLNQPGFEECEVRNSSWHGTRVASLVGALTNNAAGIAGTGWNTLLLPVRVLGKCGGFDSDIVAGMRWAAGLPVSGAPLNPTPANIINLSLGGEGACSAAYQSVVNEITAQGVLVVASVGNEGGPVSAPANCDGVLGVIGLRHAGTKVGFSNLGLAADIGAPGGNCVNAGPPCAFSIVVANNTGATTPEASTYTDQINFNVGTSFSAPLVAGAAALMHSLNTQLSPMQYVTLLKESAAPFPTTSMTTTTTCRMPTGATDVQNTECICTTQTCGAGMLNTHAAVLAAQRPFAVIQATSSINPGVDITLDARGSFASNNRSIASYQWSVVNVTGATPVIMDASQALTTLQVSGNSQFTLRLTLTDDQGAQDSADMAVATSTAPAPAPSPSPPVQGGGGGGSAGVGMLVMSILLVVAKRREMGTSLISRLARKRRIGVPEMRNVPISLPHSPPSASCISRPSGLHFLRAPSPPARVPRHSC